MIQNGSKQILIAYNCWPLLGIILLYTKFFWQNLERTSYKWIKQCPKAKNLWLQHHICQIFAIYVGFVDASPCCHENSLQSSSSTDLKLLRTLLRLDSSKVRSEFFQQISSIESKTKWKYLGRKNSKEMWKCREKHFYQHSPHFICDRWWYTAIKLYFLVFSLYTEAWNVTFF